VVNTGDGETYSIPERQPVITAAATHGGSFTTYLRRPQIADAAGTGLLDPATEAQWRLDGHETGVYVYGGDPGSSDAFDPQDFVALDARYRDITEALQRAYGHGSRTARSHTIDWVGWVDMAKIEAEYGTGLDLNYYHYWEFAAASRFPKLRLPVHKTKTHGYFTGSGLPQRFCDEHGALLPIYQLLTE